MDKEYDIDDILDFRCVAEEEQQEHMNSSLPTMMLNGYVYVQEEQQISEQSESRARGWLNWLSLGMLGAGGTADSSSFAGAVSDEIIKLFSRKLLYAIYMYGEERKVVEEKILMKKVSIVQDLADGLMALSDVRDGKGAGTGPVLMATAGLLSGVISTHKIWKACS